MKQLEQNPNCRFHENKAKTLLVEIPYGFWHLQRTFQEKKLRRNSFEEAQDYLLMAQKQLGEDTQYFAESDTPKIISHLGTGFLASAYAFDSKTGQWVIKIGAKYSPIRAKFHPNSLEFAEWYQHCLGIQIDMFQNDLPFLIPQPQTALQVKGTFGETTVIFQPLVTHILSGEQIKMLPREDKKQLQLEFDLFHQIYKQMGKSFGLIPDFELGTGIIRDTYHFVISNQYGAPHFVVLDSAPLDKRGHTPIFYQLSKLAGLIMVNTQKVKLRR